MQCTFLHLPHANTLAAPGQQANRPTGQQANRPTGQQANRPTRSTVDTEFQVNTDILGDWTTVAALSTGSFVVAWYDFSNPPNRGHNIHGQIYNANVETNVSALLLPLYLLVIYLKSALTQAVKGTYNLSPKEDPSNLNTHHVAATPLQVFLPMLVMNIQMQVGNAAQNIKEQATWLTINRCILTTRVLIFYQQ